MADKNVVTVEGNLTRDAVLIEKEGRVPVCLLRIACNRSRKNRRTGDWENHPRFFDVKAYGPAATEAATFAKGQKVRINEGYLDSYTKGEGDGRHDVVSIVAGNAPDGITLVQKAGEQSEDSAVSASDAEPTPAAAGSSKPSAGKSTKSSTKGKSTKAKSTKSKARS